MSHVPLAVISENTLLHSTLTIDAIVSYAKENNIKTLALTDRNIMYGAIPFYQKCLANGIKPIIGLKLMLFDEQFEKALPIIVYAKNQKGYASLMRLSSIVNMNETAVISINDLKENNEDLILVVEPHLKNGQLITDVLSANILWQMRENITNDLFLGIDASDLIDSELIAYRKLSRESQVELVALPTINRLYEEDSKTVDVLRAIDLKKTMEDFQDEKVGVKLGHAFESVLKIPDIYEELGFFNAIANTEKISQQIHLEIPLDQPLMPTFKPPNQKSSKDYLKELSLAGLEDRLVTTVSDAYVERLEHELDVIDEMGFSDYFLIVWDIVAYAKKQNIQTGPGRGSAAGSLVAFALNIIDVDPLKYDLLFERFLNRERFSPPDIDLDVPDNKRETIIRYIQSKYGSDYVAQIITFGTLGAKQAIRDTARIMGQSPNEIDQLSKAIPREAGMTLDKAYKADKNFNQLIRSSEVNVSIFKNARKIEGLKRNVSTHASGVVISSQPLTQLVPIQANNSNIPITQYEMDKLEKIGLVKFDILGSKNLAILNDAIRFVKRENKNFAIENIPLDDNKALHVFEIADTNGIFQFESDGMKRFLSQLKPNAFEDVVAAIALFRPGPMKEIPRFINRRNGSEPIEYVHDSLKDLLEPTNGIMIYQEQVMRAAQIVANYSLGEADILRRAMGHKDRALIEEEKHRFVEGAAANQYTTQEAEEIYHYIERFADYGFNKSHAVAYSVLSYQLAYLKANHPKAFYAAVMSHASTQKLKRYGVEAKYKGIQFIGPDINKSGYSYEPDDNGIRLGLSQIRQLQRSVITHTLKLQNGHYFEDLINYVNAMDTNDITEKNLEALIYAGAFDYSEQNRKTLIASLENILANIKNAKLSENLFSLFKPYYVETEEFSALEKAEKEFEYLNVSISSHPIITYEALRKQSQYKYMVELNEQKRIAYLATIMEVKTIQTKKGEMMARIKISDETGEIEAVVFPETYRRHIKLLEEGTNVGISIRESTRKGEKQYIVDQMTLADQLLENLPKGAIFIRLRDQVTNDQYEFLEQLSLKYSGNTPVYIFNEMNEKTYRLKEKMWLKDSKETLYELRKTFGNTNVAFQASNNK